MTASDYSLFPNRFRQALAKETSLFGVWSVLNSSDVVEGLCWSGYDWILIDNEHSPCDLGDTLHHLRAIAGTPTAPVVRLPSSDPVLIKKYLDIGAQTIMLPFVQSASEAAAAVKAMRYAPEGERGFALMHRGSRFGREKNYCAKSAEHLFLIVQIETPEAMQQVEEIAAVPGVDAVFFGPGDLSASMGHTAQPNHPDVVSAILDGQKKVRAQGKATGILALGDAVVKTYLDSGFDFVAGVTDGGLLFASADQAAEKYQAYIRDLQNSNKSEHAS